MINEIPEVPLVVSDKVEEIKKTKDAVGVLRKLKAYSDIEKVIIFSFLAVLSACFDNHTLLLCSQREPN